MQKLLNRFKAKPSAENRAKLQRYLDQHMMAVCLAPIEDQQFLKQNFFRF